VQKHVRRVPVKRILAVIDAPCPGSRDRLDRKRGDAFQRAEVWGLDRGDGPREEHGGGASEEGCGVRTVQAIGSIVWCDVWSIVARSFLTTIVPPSVTAWLTPQRVGLTAKTVRGYWATIVGGFLPLGVFSWALLVPLDGSAAEAVWQSMALVLPGAAARETRRSGNRVRTDHHRRPHWARSRSTGTLIRCCTHLEVVPRNSSATNLCPCVLIATRSQPFSSTHLTISLPGSP